jgi:hypothetical protein
MSARFSISTQSAIEIIAGGGCIVDIGQISAPTRRFLQQRVRQGVYVRFDYRGYPVAKNGYCLPQFIAARMAP